MRVALERLRASFVGREPLVFLALLLIVGGIWAVVFLYRDVRGGEVPPFDVAILKALRQPGDPQRLVGPAWVESAVRDITALGGVVVLALVVGGVCGFLVLIGHHNMMWVVVVSTLGATAINSTIKAVVDR